MARVVDDEVVVVTAFGDSTRDWSAIRDRDLNLQLLGGMGHAGSVALGVALAVQPRKVICCETDGGLLMNLGSLVTIAGAAPLNLTMMVFNNGCYESSGGQPLPGSQHHFAQLAAGSGLTRVARISTVAEFESRLREDIQRDEVTFLDVQIAHRVTEREPFDSHQLEIRETFRRGLRARATSLRTEERTR